MSSALASLASTGLFLLIVGRTQSCDVPTTEQCDGSILSCCDLQLTDTLNITNTCKGQPLFLDPNCYRQAIESKLAFGGIDGLFAFNQYYKCLGIARLNCLSSSFLPSSGVPIPFVTNLRQLMAQYDFACGAGLDTFANHDDCMTNTIKYSQVTLDGCTSTFVTNLENNPQEACGYFSEYTRCYTSPFAFNCGDEEGWWACEYVRIGVATHLPQCNQQCSVYYTGNSRS